MRSDGVTRAGSTGRGEKRPTALAAALAMLAAAPLCVHAAPGGAESAVPPAATATMPSPAGAADPVFPAVEGDNLEGRHYRLPADFEGETNVVLIAFQRWQQSQVDTWIPLLRGLAAERPDLRYYELPTIQEMNRLMRWAINSGMARGIGDPQARAATITVYLEKEAFRRSLGIRTEDVITIVVTDRSGRVYWQTVGTLTPDKEQALRRLLETR